MPSFRAGGIDNFWQDQAAVRGVWRRTSLDSYRTKTPQWETVLDIDALAKAEGANWVYKGADCLAPEERLCLVALSDGGKDAVEVREFDAVAKAFVKDGFVLPAGKQQAAWIDKDTLLVGREWTPGLVTESGYPFVIKRLKRGQDLGQAREVFVGAKGDVGVWPGVIRDADGRHVADYVTRAVGFFDSEVHIDAADIRPTLTWGTHPGTAIAVDAPIPAANDAAAQKGLDYMHFQAGKALAGTPVDVVFVGSCTNGRLSDMREVAQVLRGRRVADRVRMLVVPGSEIVKREAEAEGIHEIVRAAGAEWREPGCSMCIAMNGDLVAPGQLAVSTSNRNFEGRQGPGSRTLLASPMSAAWAAVNGHVADTRELFAQEVA
jgi:hypothetical protein